MDSPESTGLPLPLDRLDADMDPEQALWRSLGDFFVRDKDILFLHMRMILTAMAIIYLGAHGSLRRPPSAAPRTLRTKDGKKRASRKEEEKFAEGLRASDAILFPALAAVVLVGLYYLIHWLQDPDLLSKFLRYYFSLASLVSLGKWIGDSMHLATGIIFPNLWVGLNGRLYRFDSVNRRQLRRVSDASAEAGADAGGATALGVWEVDENTDSPLPGFALSSWPFSYLKDFLWSWRLLFKEQWTAKLGVHGVGQEEFQLTLNGILGVVGAAAVSVGYHMTDSSLLSNIMGLGMSYGSFMLMSPTSFSIGTMVLWGLFVYDIVMVFYTPFMVTVATKIDAPIKLTFENNARSSLLGLGDIVLPGLFICLCLRFDLWRYYQKQVKHVPTNLTTELKAPTSAKSGASDTAPQRHIETKTLEVKSEYVDAQGRWGDRLWTVLLRLRGGTPTPGLTAAAFPKTYFYASMVGYAVGMLLTISMLLVFNHGQPALLYLVPCVSGAAWLTGWWRGELSDMWIYTEDGSLDTKDTIVEVDGEGNAIQEKDRKSGDGNEGNSEDIKSDPGRVQGTDGAGESGTRGKTKGEQKSYDVFRFIITAPGTDDLDEDDI